MGMLTQGRATCFPFLRIEDVLKDEFGITVWGDRVAIMDAVKSYQGGGSSEKPSIPKAPGFIFLTNKVTFVVKGAPKSLPGRPGPPQRASEEPASLRKHYFIL